MEITDRETMDEIIAGYNGETKYESTMEDLSTFKEFVSQVFALLLDLIESIKALFNK